MPSLISSSTSQSQLPFEALILEIYPECDIIVGDIRGIRVYSGRHIMGMGAFERTVCKRRLLRSGSVTTENKNVPMGRWCFDYLLQYYIFLLLLRGLKASFQPRLVLFLPTIAIHLPVA